jgi:hypothetical protein
MTFARRISIAAAFATLTIATAASADTVAPRRVVVVHVNGTPEETTSLEETMRELLGNLQLTMATGSAPPSSVLETVTVDLTAAGAKVLVKSANGATVVERLVRGESPAIQREQIAHAVRGAAEAELLVDADRVAGRAPPVVDPPPEPPPPPPPPAPAPIVVETKPPIAEAPVAPPSSPSFGLDLSTFTGVGGFATDTPAVARVGGSIAVGSRRGLRPQIALAALYAFPFETGDDVLTSRAKLFSLRLMPGLRLLHAGWFSLETSAGGGLDVLTVDPVSSVLPGDRLARSTTRVNAIVTGAVTARATIAADVSLTLTAMVDVDPSSRTYVFLDRGRSDEVFSPWSVRPMVLAGISFAASGGGP